MNCPQVQGHLPSLLTGALDAAATADVESHLALCADCRRERAALEHVCRLLDQSRAPAVRVDVEAIRREGERRKRRARRLRRLAVGLAAAACVLVLALAQLEVRLDGHQFVVRWGKPPEPDTVRQVVRVETVRQPVDEERLRTLEALVQALAADADGRELRQAQALDRLRDEVEVMRRQAIVHREETRRNLRALYVDRFPNAKGPDE